MTAAWLCQVSGSPFTILVAVSRSHLTADLIRKSGAFTVSVLGADQKAVALQCGTQSGEIADKVAAVGAQPGPESCPTVPGAAAWLYCKVTGVDESGDHVLFQAEVTQGKLDSDNLLLYKDMR